MTTLVRFLTEPVDSSLLQLPRALIVSVLAMLLDVGLLLLLVETGAMPAGLAVALGYLAGCVVQYVLCTHWVFSGSGESPAHGFAIFTLLSTVGLAITWLAVQTLHHQLHAPYLAAKVVALGLAFTWNFLSRRVLFCRERLPASDR
jgi:putative flippase GtrA